MILKLNAMRKRVYISEIMSQNLITLNSADTLENAKRIMEENEIKQLPIIENKQIVGVLSYSDILKVEQSYAFNNDENTNFSVLDRFTIKQVMTKNLYLIPSNSMVKDVGELMKNKEFHSLPVVDDGELVGMVTAKDIIGFSVKHMKGYLYSDVNSSTIKPSSKF